MKVLVAQLCPTFGDTLWRMPGSSVHVILQVRILEWVAIPFSRGSAWPKDRTQVSCIGGRFFTIWAAREAQLKPEHAGGEKKELQLKYLTEEEMETNHFKKLILGTSLAGQQLRLQASTVGGTGLIPGQGIRMQHAMWCVQKEKKNSLK